MFGCPVPRSHSNEAVQRLDQYLLVAADGGLAILPPLIRWGCRTIGPHMHSNLHATYLASRALVLIIVLHDLQEADCAPGEQAGGGSARATCSDKRWF